MPPDSSRCGRGRANTASLEDLRDPEIRHVAIANPAYAPYGVAAAEALRRAGVWDELQSRGRLVFGENIRQTLQYAESGNADAAVVAWSHVFDSGGVLVPKSLYTPVRQAGAVVRADVQGRRRGPISRVFDRAQRVRPY